MNELQLLWKELTERARQKTKAVRALAAFLEKKEVSIYTYFSRENIPKGTCYNRYLKALREFLKKYPDSEAIDKYLLEIGELPIEYVPESFYMNKYKMGYSDLAILKKKYPDQFLVFKGLRYVKEGLIPEKNDDVVVLQDEVKEKTDKLMERYPNKMSFCVAMAPKIGILPRDLKNKLFKYFKITERPTAKNIDLYKKILPILDEELKSCNAVEKATA